MINVSKRLINTEMSYECKEFLFALSFKLVLKSFTQTLKSCPMQKMWHSTIKLFCITKYIVGNNPLVVPTLRLIGGLATHPPFQYTTFNILNCQIIKCLLTLENPRPFGLPMLGQIHASTKNSIERKRGGGRISMKKFVKNFLRVAKSWRKKKK